MSEMPRAIPTRHRRSTTRIALAGVASLLVLGACGSDDDGSADAAPSATASVATTASPTTESVRSVATTSPPTTRTVTLVGQLIVDYRFDPPAADGTGTYTGTEELTGDIEGTGEAQGTYLKGSGPEMGGTGTRTISGRVAGIGDGTITLSYRWTKHADTTDSVGEITGGTGAFQGATGRGESHAITGEKSLSYTLELTLPSDRFDASFGAGPGSSSTTTG